MNNRTRKPSDELTKFRTLGMTLLQLMLLLGAIGVAVAAILYWFF